MNPSKNIHNPPQPTAKLMMDITRKPLQPAAPKPTSQLSDGFKPDIVGSIPVKAQAAQAPKAGAREDDDLDKIMADVNRDLRQMPKRPGRRGLFSWRKKPAAVPAETAPRPAVAAQAPVAPAVKPAANRIKPKAAVPPKNHQSSAPALAIAMAVIITGGLIAAAYYAYK